MDRTQAIERLRRAIDEYHIHGLETTLEFGRYVLDHDAFISGRFDTGFVGTHFDADRFETYRAERRAQGHWSAVTAVLEAQGETVTSAAPRPPTAGGVSGTTRTDPRKRQLFSPVPVPIAPCGVGSSSVRSFSLSCTPCRDRTSCRTPRWTAPPAGPLAGSRGPRPGVPSDHPLSTRVQAVQPARTPRSQSLALRPVCRVGDGHP